MKITNPWEVLLFIEVLTIRMELSYSTAAKKYREKDFQLSFQCRK